MTTADRSRSHRLRAVVGGLAVTAVPTLARRRRQLSAIAPEMRNALMWLPLSIGSRLELEVGRRLFLPTSAPVDGVTVTTREVPGGRGVVVYEPAGRTGTTGALLWIHGGGMIMGTPEASHHTCSHLARELGVPVISARYRLAPEHPFPAGLDDCMAALRWTLDSLEELRVDRDRIVVGGESAGGGLAATLVQRALDEGTQVAFQLLVYPMLDDRTPLRDTGSRGTFVWTPRSNRWAWTAYLGHAPSEQEPRPYAAGARREDVSGLPPTWIGVGDLDLFHDEDLAYASRLKAAGVPVEVHVQPGMPHGVDIAATDPGPVTRAFRDAWIGALRGALAGPSPRR